MILGAIAFGWLVIGLVSSLIMARRGHNFSTWWYFGAFFGPFVIPLATYVLLTDEPHTKWVAAPINPDRLRANLRVLVGYDGSKSSFDALRAALPVLGPERIDVTLLTVLDLDTPLSESGVPQDDSDEQKANRALREASAQLRAVYGLAPSAAVRTGEPVHALLQFAKENDSDVIVVGRRGAGASNRILGSVADALTEASHLPVLFG
jgi:nucleotide-binding universal stress UspA family protein